MRKRRAKLIRLKQKCKVYNVTSIFLAFQTMNYFKCILLVSGDYALQSVERLTGKKERERESWTCNTLSTLKSRETDKRVHSASRLLLAHQNNFETNSSPSAHAQKSCALNTFQATSGVRYLFSDPTWLGYWYHRLLTALHFCLYLDNVLKINTFFWIAMTLAVDWPILTIKR